jgi:hypothetical protein
MRKKLSGTFLLLSAACASSSAATVNFSTFVSSGAINAVEGQTNTIGFTYAGNKFVGSVYFGANNNQLYQTDLTGGNVQKFGTPMPASTTDEVVLAASLGQAGFATGDIYAGSASNGNLYHYSNAGGAPGLFATLPNGDVVKSILFDPGASFGGNMLVSTGSGRIYSITSAGVVTQITNIGTLAEGMDILGSNWGTLAGDLVVAAENANAIYLVDKTTHAVVTSLGGLQLAETVSFVPLNLGASGNPVEGFYVANYAVDIQKAAANQFATLTGDLIVTGETPNNSPLYDIGFSGNALSPFVLKGQVGTLPLQSEDGIFVTAQRIDLLGTPEPSSVVLFGTLVLGFAFMVMRKRRQSRAV